MMGGYLLVNDLDSVLIFSLKRYLHYVFKDDYKIFSIKPNKLKNAGCYFLIQDEKTNLSDEICKIRNYEYKKAKEGDEKIIFKPIFILKYLEDGFNINQEPFYKIINVEQLHEISKVNELGALELTKKEYQARRNIREVCGGYLRKLRHDLKALPLDKKKEKFERLKGVLTPDILSELKGEIGL